MWLSIAHNEDIDTWVAERHYLKSRGSCASTIRMWFLSGNKAEFIDDTKKVGAMLWNHPTARLFDNNTLLELTRMYFIDDTEPNIESKALAMARRHIRRNYPHIKGVIAYSSTGHNHDGTIYKADNWFTMGTRKGTTWARTNRARADADDSDKILWARSP